MKNKLLTGIFTYIIIISFVAISPVYGLNAVASLGKIKGIVEISRDDSKITGRKGLILQDKDQVITGVRSKATIIFRDGSEIRLFQKTKFIIEKSIEQKGQHRGFLNNFRLAVGSFWGKFTKRRQKTRIKTPTATIGIKGTSVVIGTNRVSLTEGLISVGNLENSIDLPPGKMMVGITTEGDLKSKVQDIPNRVVIRPDHFKIKIPKTSVSEEIAFDIQIVNIKTGKNVSRSGDIYISSGSDKIVFPDDIRLNKRGYARVNVKVYPFKKSDYKNGQVEIFATLEGEQAMDIGSGQATLTYDIPKKLNRTIRINVNSGEVQR